MKSTLNPLHSCAKDSSSGVSACHSRAIFSNADDGESELNRSWESAGHIPIDTHVCVCVFRVPLVQESMQLPGQNVP